MHALHLLIVKDGIEKVEELKTVIKKCSQIVTKLHFKGCELQIERTNFEDVKAMDQIMMKVSATFELLEMEAASPVLYTETDTDDSENGRVGAGAGRFHHVHELLKKSSCYEVESYFSHDK